jgi:aldehyde dehydrogenase (NAD+)
MDDLLVNQRAFFSSGATRSRVFRSEMLTRLARAIADYEEDILNALRHDLGKSPVTGYAAEIGQSLTELRFAQRHLKRWMRPKRTGGACLFPLSKGRIVSEPLGVCLIITPWNYPFGLVMAPLISAIAAGNCVVIKPSEIAANTEQVISQMIADRFGENFVAVVSGGPEVSQQLLRHRFDHIFYTGGAQVAKIVMTAAARTLTPLTLELGGKSPCIVAEDCDLTKTARRLAWGKFLNAGQTCVAPDYVLVQRSVKAGLLTQLRASIKAFYGPDPQTSADYGRLISISHFDRVAELLREGRIILGGRTDRRALYISPTLIDDVPPEGRLMDEEIFGPLLPILEYEDLSDALNFVDQRPKPLALYVFSRSRVVQERVIAETSSGGVCVNDTIVHLSTPNLPFGGVGASGFGRYHGKAGFDTFSNSKSVLYQTLRFDLPKRFPPSNDKDLRFLRWLSC